MHTNICPLIVDAHGRLAFLPTNPEALEWTEGKPMLVIYSYPSGDVDVFSWPLNTTFRAYDVQLSQIAMAMADERECGRIGSEVTACSLPDGRILAL